MPLILSTKSFRGRRRALGVTAALAVLLLPGCGGGAPPAARVTFAAVETAAGPVTVEGVPDLASVRKETGKDTELTLREEGSGDRMTVVAPAGISVPANLTSARTVVVTGAYDSARRALVATEIRTRVPNRDQQDRG